MKVLRSHVLGAWHTAESGFAELHDPCTGDVIASASSEGVDFGEVLAYARDVGGPKLRAMSFAERGAVLKGMSKALQEHRDELIELSRLNTGVTDRDAQFDLDGATGTLGYYAFLSKGLGDRHVLADGEGAQLARAPEFHGQHVLVPLAGVAVHINAFNFPAWGFAEKAACALLAGVPVISKPATSSAMVTERCVEILVDAGVLPEGAFQLVCGRTGDLLSRLGSQDVLAFTGSADTALKLRRGENLLATNARVNLEADSLNAAVLGSDATEGELFDLFIRDVAREMTQKSGQKCTAVRRILVPAGSADAVQEALAARLARVAVGNPADESVRMGPLATRQQLDDAVAGVAKLATEAEIVHGSGEQVDGVGAQPGRGYFFAPTLLRLRDASSASEVHRHEVFGPVATIVPFDGQPATAADLVKRADGTLVVSVYSDDAAYVGAFVAAGGSYTGRLYLGSTEMSQHGMGSGLALPQSLHGGPGRAGGGAELAGLDGLRLYQQRVALQGGPSMIQALTRAE